MHKIIIIIFISMIYQPTVYSSAKEAFEIYKKDKTNERDKKIARELIDGEYYFSAIPYINEYLDNNQKIDKFLEADIETLVIKTGTMAVLNLDEKKLEKFNIPSVALILGTRLFNKEKYDDALKALEKIPENHKFIVEASLIKGTIKNLQKKPIEAAMQYEKCSQKAIFQTKSSKGEKLKKYYEYLNETCIIRIARNHLEQKRFEESIQTYQRIDKRSYKWPYILIEQAWANYYLEDYNRTLGLTVTYKSPLLETYFMPEVEVLSALAYYNLCLWDDSLKVVNYFYDFYKPKADALKDILGKNKNSNTYFLDLYYADTETRENLNPFIRNLITQTRKQIKFNLDLSSLKSAKEELNLLRRLKNKNKFTISMEKNLESTIEFISKKINFYIKKEIFVFINEIHKHSYSMFNLKLELLSKKREDIYNPNNDLEKVRTRGEVSSVNRKSSQYFFDFNGSFWADELGDYSFGLKSECTTEVK